MEAIIAKHGEQRKRESEQKGGKNERDTSPAKPEGERQ
jgi:hypothetical protein